MSLTEQKNLIAGEVATAIQSNQPKAFIEAFNKTVAVEREITSTTQYSSGISKSSTHTELEYQSCFDAEEIHQFLIDAITHNAERIVTFLLKQENINDNPSQRDAYLSAITEKTSPEIVKAFITHAIDNTKDFGDAFQGIKTLIFTHPQLSNDEKDIFNQRVLARQTSLATEAEKQHIQKNMQMFKTGITDLLKTDLKKAEEKVNAMSDPALAAFCAQAKEAIALITIMDHTKTTLEKESFTNVSFTNVAVKSTVTNVMNAMIGIKDTLIAGMKRGDANVVDKATTQFEIALHGAKNANERAANGSSLLSSTSAKDRNELTKILVAANGALQDHKNKAETASESEWVVSNH